MNLSAIIYLDDILVVGESLEEVRARAAYVLGRIQETGGEVSKKKSMENPAERFVYNGVEWDPAGRAFQVASEVERGSCVASMHTILSGQTQRLRDWWIASTEPQVDTVEQAAETKMKVLSFVQGEDGGHEPEENFTVYFGGDDHDAPTPEETAAKDVLLGGCWTGWSRWSFCACSNSRLVTWRPVKETRGIRGERPSTSWKRR